MEIYEKNNSLNVLIFSATQFCPCPLGAYIPTYFFTPTKVLTTRRIFFLFAIRRKDSSNSNKTHKCTAKDLYVMEGLKITSTYTFKHT
jgi:hypothetical protein